ncbi:MAG: sulfite oxidase [Proteobacteria bacterium]|nr:sulfite oxidase [Pseudomonadota bacterium]
MGSKRQSIQSFFAENGVSAERLLYGRVPHADRRGFLKGAGLAGLSVLLGSAIPFQRSLPLGLIPVALADAEVMAGKDGLSVLNDRPVNAETPPHLLDDEVTPTARHFIRNNGIPPENMDAAGWELTVDGLVKNPLKLSIDQLKSDFEVVTQNLVIECGGNGRAFFEPPARGNQWTLGAVACSAWTGVRLADVLRAASPKGGVIYTAHEGADSHLSGDPGKFPISRGVPIAKAMNSSNLIAFEQNGGPIHPMNGAPLRLVVPGWPGSCSQKWLTRIWLRDRVHDGAKMTGTSYRVPKHPVAPGTRVPEEDFEIIQAMPVKSLITFPSTGTKTELETITVRGHAWAGDRLVNRVEVSRDFGATWQEARCDDPVNPYAWQRFEATLGLPEKGYYEIWARATDDASISQPFAIDWNPKGYLNNSYHRISVTRV